MEINERLDKIEKSLSEINTSLANIVSWLSKPANSLKIVQSVPEPPKPVEPPKPPKPVEAKVEAKLETPAPIVPMELLNLLNSKQWPHAVDPSLICDITSDQDKEDRAEGILDLIIDVHLENLKFLDFGCGEGHVVNRSRSQKPKMAVGYDIKKTDKWETWEKSPNILFTNDWKEVKRFGPYNVVLMYDVLDHITGNENDVVEILKNIKASLAINGKVYVRTHPWCSRHGTHLYHQVNKAFVHMVFTDEELKSLGYKQEEVRKVMTPLMEYSHLFNAAGLKIQSGPHAIRESVEPFFTNNQIIVDRIKNHYKNSARDDLRNGKFPTGPMEHQFIDYILM